MAFEITTVDVWAGEVDDRLDALAEKLEALQRAGANLEFAILRPSPDVTSGASLLFVAPLIGAEQTKAAESVGLAPPAGRHTLRIIGPDRPGLLAGATRALAEAGIRVDGLWAARIEDHAVQYVRVESGPDAKRSAQLLARLLG